MNVDIYETIADFSVLEEEDEEREDHRSCHDDGHSDEDDEECDEEDSVVNRLLNRPIVVGYSFGPKKMSTMGVVMAEASKTRLNTSMFQDVLEQHPEYQEEDEEERQQGEQAFRQQHPAGDNLLLTKEALTHFGNEPPLPRPFAAHAISTNRSVSSYHSERGKKNKRSAPPAPPTSVLFSLDHSYLNVHARSSLFSNNSQSDIVRQLNDSPPSTSSWGSTGTRTASTCASFRTLSAGGTGSITGSTNNHHHNTAASCANEEDSSSRAKSGTHRQHRTPKNPVIRVAFVPLDPEIPLSEQHGGMDVILHKLTEDILLLSQLSCQYPSLKYILQLPQETDMEQVLADCQLQEESDRAAIRRVFRLCQFQKQHGCYLVDDPVAVLTLMSRADIARVLQQCLFNVTSSSGIPVRSPKYAVVVPPTKSPTHLSPNQDRDDGDDGEPPHEEKSHVKNEAAYKAVQDAQLSFPLIVKPLTAAGTKASHAMAVVTHPSGLPRATERIPSCLLQEYANHNATLYKVYVLGEFVSVHKRRSLPNLPSNTAASLPVVEFDSQRPYPRLRDFGYPPLGQQQQSSQQDPHSMDDATVEMTEGKATSEGKKHVPLSTNWSSNDLLVTAEEVKPIAEALKQAFGLQIFGFDILITTNNNNKDEKEPTMLVVDVNYFPSYKEVPNFPALLAKYLTGRAIASRLEKAIHHHHPKKRPNEPLLLLDATEA